MSAIRIAPAQFADVEAVARIERAVFPDPWSEAAFRSLPGDPRVFFFCARSTAQSAGGPATGDPIAGYVVAVFAADEGEITNLAVSSEMRGRGVGGMLLDAVLHEAEVRHAVALYLEVRESNGSALRLYTARAFAAVGRRRGYYRSPAEDALILRRPVNAGLR